MSSRPRNKTIEKLIEEIFKKPQAVPETRLDDLARQVDILDPNQREELFRAIRDVKGKSRGKRNWIEWVALVLAVAALALATMAEHSFLNTRSLSGKVGALQTAVAQLSAQLAEPDSAGPLETVVAQVAPLQTRVNALETAVATFTPTATPTETVTPTGTLTPTPTTSPTPTSPP